MPDDKLPGDEGDEPIAEIAALREDAGAGFLTRLRRRIERRSLTKQFLGFSWDFPKVILVELLEFVFSLFAPRHDGGGGSK